MQLDEKFTEFFNKANKVLAAVKACQGFIWTTQEILNYAQLIRQGLAIPTKLETPLSEEEKKELAVFEIKCADFQEFFTREKIDKNYEELKEFEIKKVQQELEHLRLTEERLSLLRETQAQIEKLSIKLQLEQLQRLSDLLQQRISAIQKRFEILAKKREQLKEEIKKIDNLLEKLYALREEAMIPIYLEKDAIIKEHDMKTINMMQFDTGFTELLRRFSQGELTQDQTYAQTKELYIQCKSPQNFDLSSPNGASKFTEVNRHENNKLDGKIKSLLYSSKSDNVNVLNIYVTENKVEKLAKESECNKVEEEMHALQKEKDRMHQQKKEVGARVGEIHGNVSKTFTLPLPQDKEILQEVEVKVDELKKMESQVVINLEKKDLQIPQSELELESKRGEINNLKESSSLESDDEPPSFVRTIRP